VLSCGFPAERLDRSFVRISQEVRNTFRTFGTRLGASIELILIVGREVNPFYVEATCYSGQQSLRQVHSVGDSSHNKPGRFLFVSDKFASSISEVEGVA
jgi:hypothetical protein